MALEPDTTIGRRLDRGQPRAAVRLQQEIWNFAEPAWREYKSSRAYVDLLRAEGLTVEEGSGGMPTAFAATWGSGRRSWAATPNTTRCPGNSQQVVPYRAPREGLHPWTAGHTDPHSSLGTAALAGMLATKAAMQQHGLRGTLKFFGEPAEKVCGSKPVHAAKGYYDGCDAFIAYHPHSDQHGAGRDPVRRLLERRDHLRDADARDVDRQVAAADPHIGARRGAVPRRDRRALPDVHDHEIHQGGDVSARRRLDAERVHPGRRRRDLRQPAAAVQPDPVFVALAVARGAAADLSGAGQQRASGGGDVRLPGVGPLGDEDARRPAEQHDDRSGVSQHGSDRRAGIRRRGAGVRPRDPDEPRHRSRWTIRSPPTISA